MQKTFELKQGKLFKTFRQSSQDTDIYKEKSKRSSSLRLYPLVTDFNPALPNVGHILNKHKNILKLDTELCKVIIPENIFTSFRGAKTLNDLLIHSRIPPLVEDYPPDTSEEAENVMGCWPCKHKCNLCKYYLKQSKTVTSFHTNTVFKIKEYIDCDSENAVYLINDLVCQISSVGCTAISTKERFRNHKSHIKKMRATCEVSTHFMDNKVVHPLDTSTYSNYDSSLSSQIEVIIIEKVNVSNPNASAQERLKEIKSREWYWQNQLKTLRQYGGMNVREEKS